MVVVGVVIVVFGCVAGCTHWSPFMLWPPALAGRSFNRRNRRLTCGGAWWGPHGCFTAQRLGHTPQSIRHWLCRVCCLCWCWCCSCGSCCWSCSLLLLRLVLLWVWLWLRLLAHVPCQAHMAMAIAALRAYIPNTIRQLLCMTGLCLGAVVSAWWCLSRCLCGCFVRCASVCVSLCS